MAASEHAAHTSGVVPFPNAREITRPSLAAEMARLASLHAEAAETARLANLLGRSAYATATITLATGLVAALAWSAMAHDGLIAWLALVAIGVVGLARAYAQAIRAPFERAPLTGFAQDLTTLLTYAGFAWGAGAFLALPIGAGLWAAAGFAVLPAALLAAMLRAAGPSLFFLAPAAGLSAFAMVLRPLPGGVLGAALTVLATGVIAAAAVWVERRGDPRLPALAELPLV